MYYKKDRKKQTNTNFFKRYFISYKVRYNLLKNKIRIKLAKLSENKVYQTFMYMILPTFIVYGFFLNLIFYTFFGFPFNIYTFGSFGFLYLLIYMDLPLWIRKFRR